jgi:hypothetical protein
MNRGQSLGGFQSRRDCDPKPRVARNELPWVGLGISTNPSGVAPARRNPVGVVNSRKLAPGVGPLRGPTPGSGTESPWDSREVQRHSSWEAPRSEPTCSRSMNRGERGRRCRSGGRLACRRAGHLARRKVRRALVLHGKEFRGAGRPPLRQAGCPPLRKAGSRRARSHRPQTNRLSQTQASSCISRLNS